jgi:hypothetical protein
MGCLKPRRGTSRVLLRRGRTYAYRILAVKGQHLATNKNRNSSLPGGCVIMATRLDFRRAPKSESAFLGLMKRGGLG